MYDHSSSRISSTRLRKARFFKKAGTFIVVLLIAAFGMVYVWQRVQVIAIGYQIEALKKEKDELLRTNKALDIETATLTSPERIDAIARHDMGMTDALDTQLVVVKLVKKGPGAGAGAARRAEKPKAAPGKS